MSDVLHDRAWIAARIPHAGSMCLLDSVVRATPQAIHCRATSHRDAANPLRARATLGAAHGIEYAAQAMAVHGALRAGNTDAPRAGYLTSVREVVFHAGRLDTAASPLEIHAECLSGEGNHLIYAFRLEAAGAPLVTGRASVMIDASAGATA
ncbi:MAG: 3-hydroxylacyl-ACP dehydratase [Candidatus Dactylopiibacterium sp.]|nr:3-hydroxylacyl-ACP dehydratase [Candidatus Dactylopiibacterium sp.]